jgi:hypothetical protein
MTDLSIDSLLASISQQPGPSFQDTMAVIAAHYHYTPTAFRNGIAAPIVNAAGSNEGSCKLFAFAQLQQLSVADTLALFGDYYRMDVLQHPEGNDHQNIRRFMQDGWAGIAFDGEALQAR